MKQKTYPVEEKKDDSIKIHIDKKPVWIKSQTVRSEQYSYYDKAERKEKEKIRQKLKEYIDK